jgi:hypothetical protein
VGTIGSSSQLPSGNTLNSAAAVAGQTQSSGLMTANNAVPENQISVVSASVNPGQAPAVLDGDPSTSWTASNGASIVLGLQQDTTISALTYTHGSTQNNYLTNYKVSVSEDGQNWSNPVATGTLSHTQAQQTIQFPQPKQGKFVKLDYTSVGGGSTAQTASIGVMGTGATTQIASCSAPDAGVTSSQVNVPAPVVLPPAPPQLASGGTCTHGSGAVHYASPGDNLAQAVSALQPGDTLYLHAGTYNDTISNPPGGTSSNPVTIAGYPGEVVTMNSPGADTIFSFTSASSSYVIVDNFVMDGTGMTNNLVKIGDGANHICVQNSEIKNGHYSGILTGGTGNSFINLHIHNLGTTNLDHGIYQVGDHTLLQGNLIHDIPGFGIHNYDGGSTPNVSDNLMVGNIVHDTGSAGILISMGNNNIAHNNISYNSNTEGIKLYGGSNAQVYNNTMYNNKVDCVYNAQDNLTFQNNICWKNGNDSVHQDGGSVTQSNNLMGIDPLFVNPPSDFHLQPGSPGLTAGTGGTQVGAYGP